MTIVVRDMLPEDEDYVSMCGHSLEEMDENPVFIKDCHQFRIHRKNWFKEKYSLGFRAKVALLDNKKGGFLYVMPIEICPWGPIGKELLVITCLNTDKSLLGKGIGSALLQEAEKEIKKQGKKGIVIIAFDWKEEFWFLPASYFRKLGYKEIKKRKHPEGFYEEVMLWKTIDSTAKKPNFLEANYEFRSIKGKVVIDLFYDTFCETANTEAWRVREVAAEYGEEVILREYSADNREQLLKHQISRGIFVNGKEISWGYEAPREGIREAIENAKKRNQ